MTSPHPPSEAVLHLAPPLTHAKGLRLIDVEGALGALDVQRWRGLLNGILEDGTTGLAVDLRGCRSIDSECLSMLEGTAERLGSRGGGVSVVVFPGSGVARRLGLFTGTSLPTFDSAAAAMLSLA